MAKISTPHNNFFEAMLSNKEIVTDFLKSHLPMDIQGKLDFDSIKAEKDTFVSEGLKKSETDILRDYFKDKCWPVIQQEKYADCF